MPMQAKSPLRLEIGHVLFIDIVGYSALLLNEQSDLLAELNEVVSRDGKMLTPYIRFNTSDVGES